MAAATGPGDAATAAISGPGTAVASGSGNAGRAGALPAIAPSIRPAAALPAVAPSIWPVAALSAVAPSIRPAAAASSSPQEPLLPSHLPSAQQEPRACLRGATATSHEDEAHGWDYADALSLLLMSAQQCATYFWSIIQSFVSFLMIELEQVAFDMKLRFGKVFKTYVLARITVFMTGRDSVVSLNLFYTGKQVLGQTSLLTTNDDERRGGLGCTVGQRIRRKQRSGSTLTLERERTGRGVSYRVAPTCTPCRPIKNWRQPVWRLTYCHVDSSDNVAASSAKQAPSVRTPACGDRRRARWRPAWIYARRAGRAPRLTCRGGVRFNRRMDRARLGPHVTVHGCMLLPPTDNSPILLGAVG
ncbi:hypothetical protein ACP70R_035774 [Stipagrostis hirtigluma subsp. patula]